MLEVRDLELIEAITTHGSFARAARVLGVGQPALTRQIAALERRLRGTLFLRGHQGVEQTDLCRALMADAGDLLARFRALNTRLGQVRGGQDRELAVAAGGYAAETVGMAALARMLVARPRVQLRFASMNWVQALARLRDREAELAILEIGEFADEPDLLIEPLRRHAGAFAARVGHPLAGRRGLTLADILAYPLCFVGRAPDRIVLQFSAAREIAQQAGGAHPAFPAAVIESPAAALPVARASDAVVPVTGSVVAPWLRSGEIILLPWHEPWLSTNFGIVHLRARPPSEATAMFIECLRQADREAEAEDAALLAAVASGGAAILRTAPDPVPPGRSADALPDARAAQAPLRHGRAPRPAPSRGG
jgi:DNA-binding transcriptional LysR family regulator